MSDTGKAIIRDGIQNGVALGTAAASGNIMGAVIDGAKLAKDGAMAAQGIAHSSTRPGQLVLINLEDQNLYLY